MYLIVFYILATNKTIINQIEKFFKEKMIKKFKKPFTFAHIFN